MFKSKKQSAIESFRRQKEKIGQLSEENFIYWLVETCDLIKIYVGEDTIQQKGLVALFNFTGYPTGIVSATIKHKSKEIEGLLDTCISYIKEHGIFLEPKHGLSEGWQIFWATAFIGVFLATMPFVCQYGKDQSAIEWRDEKKQLYFKIDSLTNALFSTPNIKSDNTAKPK